MLFLNMPLKQYALKIYNRFIDLAPRSKEPYATHVPVLVGVAAAYKPKLLIEFGAGSFSTLSFMDQIAFPSLEEVRSYENNEQWLEQIQERSRGSSRVNLQYVAGDMYQAVAKANVDTADMIFLDDSPTAQARVPTVKEVSRLCGERPIVILHDYELWRLRLAAREFENCVAFDTFNPQCCAVWHGHPERRSALENINRTIHQHEGDIPLTDIRAWANTFARR
jgi:hypothetical protein